MFDEDRERALELYNSIFDEVEDENAVLQLLVSPTRQAVNLSRSYDEKERRQQLASGYLMEEPAFVQTIEDLRSQVEAMGLSTAHVDDDQFSLFDEPDAAQDVIDVLGHDYLSEQTTAPSRAPELQGEETRFPDEDLRADPASSAPAPEQADIFSVPPQAPEQDEAPADDEVAAFINGFSIPDEDPDPAERGKSAHAGASADQQTLYYADSPDEDVSPPALKTANTRNAVKVTGAAIPESAPEKVRKPRVVLLMLFILLAVPITLALICLLLVPAALALALAAAGLASGVWGLVSAFTCFSVFADMLMVFGLALIAAALGILFFWIFIWLLFCVIPDLIRSMAALARRWCYKEVTV